MRRSRPLPTRWLWFLALLGLGMAGPAAAHNPIFTPGPHLVFRDAVLVLGWGIDLFSAPS